MVHRNVKYYFQVQDMNDGGEWNVTLAASSPSPIASNAFSPMHALSKELEILLQSKSRSKEQDEPLPGKFLSVSPSIYLTDFSLQNIPYLTPTQRAASVLNHSRLSTPPPLPPWWQILLLGCHSVSAFRAPSNTRTVSRAWSNISRGSSTEGNSTLAEPET